MKKKENSEDEHKKGTKRKQLSLCPNSAELVGLVGVQVTAFSHLVGVNILTTRSSPDFTITIVSNADATQRGEKQKKNDSMK
jgi:hypothetical protein